MPQCAIGREIIHGNAETHPGYQEPCGKSVSMTVVLADGEKVHLHEMCHDHVEDLRRRGLVSAPLPVRVAE